MSGYNRGADYEKETKAKENNYERIRKGKVMPGMKKLTPKQMKIASAAAPKDQITGADFAALKKKPAKKKNIMSNYGRSA